MRRAGEERVRRPKQKPWKSEIRGAGDERASTERVRRPQAKSEISGAVTTLPDVAPRRPTGTARGVDAYSAVADARTAMSMGEVSREPSGESPWRARPVQSRQARGRRRR